jgi:uncharacterized OB-fold protein
MTMESQKQSIPVIEGLFTWPSDNPQLIGTRCLSCNSYYFPKKQSCNNPNCRGKEVQEVLLSTEGKLWSYTLMRYQPVPPFRAEQKPPYAVGLVELTEGIRVLGFVTDCEFKELAIGMEMKLIVEILYRNEEGQEVVTWKFRPMGRRSRSDM